MVQPRNTNSTAQPKRKAAEPAPAAGSAKRTKAAGKAKGGRPTAAQQLSKEAAAAAGMPAAERSIAGMFGARIPFGSKAPATFTSDLKRWTFCGVGGEDAITQKQVLKTPKRALAGEPLQ